MVRAERPALRLGVKAASSPEGQDLIVSAWLDNSLVTPLQAVTPAKDDFGVKEDAQPSGLA